MKDFDIGTFIYILLTLIFIVIGSMSKKKKVPPKTPTSAQEPEAEETDAITENFRKLFGDMGEPVRQESDYESLEDSVISEEEVKLDTVYDRIDTPESRLDVPYVEDNVSEPYKMEDHIQEIMDQTQRHMEGKTTKKSNYVTRALRGFDPKKALLYSEIFRPKYF